MPRDLPVQLSVGLAEANAEELDELTVALRRELVRELAVDARPTTGDAVPKDAKGDPFSIGILALAVLPTLLPKLLEFSQQWVCRGQGRSLRVKVAEGDKLVEIELSHDPASLEKALAFAREQSSRWAS